MSEREERPGKVLVADADGARRAALVRLVRAAGHEPLEARNSREALGLLWAGAVDVALLDSQLPDTGADEILEQARALPRAVPVLLIGAPGPIHEAVQAMQHGARHYLTRPLTGPEISEALREALQAVRAAAAEPPARAPDETALQARKMEAVGRLASGVAHDFNNLLTVLTGYGELLLGALPSFHPARPYAEQILRAVERGAAVTRQLLSFSRRQVPQAVVLDLNEVVQRVGQMLRPLIGEHVELRYELSARPCPVKADAGQLEQVLVNLAVNARDAMPCGGRLTLRTANGAAGPPADGDNGPAGGWVVLTVSDTGVGMDEPTRARIFEPFFTTKEPGKGTGLGLATVQGIVAHSGGRIVVDSEPGRGTTFRIYLPCAAEAPRPADGPAAPPPPRGCETVLLLEDEEAVRLLVQQFLQRQGYRVLVAADGERALRLAAEHTGPIHLLITDVVMPRLSGGEVARQVAQVRPGIGVLFISGYTNHPVLQEPLTQGHAAALAKPFTLGVLARKVREMLDRGDDKVTR
jgi:signal transduction histidine kinase